MSDAGSAAGENGGEAAGPLGRSRENVAAAPSAPSTPGPCVGPVEPVPAAAHGLCKLERLRLRIRKCIWLRCSGDLALRTLHAECCARWGQNSSTIRAMADALVTSGLRDAGYRTVLIQEW